MAVAKKKKRNPQDSTLRNVRSANTKFRDLHDRLCKLEQQAHDLWSLSAKIQNIDARLTNLQDLVPQTATTPVKMNP